MLKKLSDILNYYDSEIVELLLGAIWLVFFPIIWTGQYGVNVTLLIISILLGSSLIKGTCARCLKTKKTLAYGSFLFSIAIIVLLCLNKGISTPSNWLWTLPLLMSIINLSAVTSQYYRKQK
jgi:hypothetical protein|tara:strand:+ start:14224 stop:14589 length:366 start_codon:yes stop_codon:yes gene_type:complete